MRPFDLKLWKAGEPVITRDGREVKELTYFRTKKGIWKVYGTVDGELNSWNDAGTLVSYRESHLDLFHPEPEMWVNVYQSKGGAYYTNIYQSKEKAESCIALIGNNYIGTYKLVKE